MQESVVDFLQDSLEMAPKVAGGPVVEVGHHHQIQERIKLLPSRSSYHSRTKHRRQTHLLKKTCPQHTGDNMKTRLGNTFLEGICQCMLVFEMHLPPRFRLGILCKWRYPQDYICPTDKLLCIRVMIRQACRQNAQADSLSSFERHRKS